MGKLDKKEISLYIHIPFCIRKCNYCDFLSFSDCPMEAQKAYMDKLMQEIEGYSGIAEEYQAVSVFLGGGTPSCLPEGWIEQLFHKLYSVWTVKQGAEITIECNPGTLTYRKLAEYRTCGINRLSLGLQSGNAEELKRLGRIHNYEQFVANYLLAREAGFQNINVDIMLGLPGQSQSTYGKTLARVLELKPEHISAYSLSIEAGTPFAEDKTIMEQLPSEQAERNMYHYTRRLLNSLGYEQYEISNFARKGYACLHNLGYWTGREYLGFGLGASSDWQGYRFENTRDMQEYLTERKETIPEALWRNRIPITERNRMEEFMFLGLRLTDGVSDTEFIRRFHRSLEEVYGAVIRSYVDMGFLVWKNGNLRLEDRGIDVSNQILADFLLEPEEKTDGILM